MAAAATAGVGAKEAQLLNKPPEQLGKGDDELSAGIRQARENLELLEKLNQPQAEWSNESALRRVFDALQTFDLEKKSTSFPLDQLIRLPRTNGCVTHRASTPR